MEFKLMLRLLNLVSKFEVNLFKWKLDANVFKNQHGAGFFVYVGPVAFGSQWDFKDSSF